MSVQYGGDKITFSDGSTVGNGWSGFKNRIINGAMVIDQRNAGASVTNASGYTLDRWSVLNTTGGTINVQQSSTVPSGFRNSIGITVGTADTSVAAGDSVILFQVIEGFNLSDLGFGTASPSTLTISFWVQSSLVGTYTGSIVNGAGTRSYPFQFAINSANTWEQKTITLTADTTGTWESTNGAGAYIEFSLICGSTFAGTAGSWQAGNFRGTSSQVNLMATSGNTFRVTGVQLEKGSTATSFDYRPYGTELQLCQRYCYVDGYTGNAYTRFPLAYAIATNQSLCVLNFPILMRTAPSLTWSGPFAEVLNSGGGATGTSVSITSDGSSASHAAIIFTYSSGSVTGNSLNAIRINNSTSWYARFEAEL